MKNNIVSFTKQKDKSDFSIFINYFEEFYKYVIRDYQIFVNKFTFDSVYKEFIKEKEDFINSMNSQLKHLQNQLISLPIAFFITIISQLIAPIPSFFRISILVLFIIYLIIQLIIVCSHQSEKKYLDKKITEKKTEFESKKVYEHFESDFTNLFNRIRTLNSIIVFVFIFIGALFIITCAFIFFKIPINVDEKNILNLIKITF